MLGRGLCGVIWWLLSVCVVCVANLWGGEGGGGGGEGGGGEREGGGGGAGGGGAGGWGGGGKNPRTRFLRFDYRGARSRHKKCGFCTFLAYGGRGAPDLDLTLVPPSSRT